MSDTYKPFYLYLYIGNSISDLDRKSIRFVIQREKPIKDESTFSGVVVARNKNAPYPMGHSSWNWVNPIHESKAGAFPCFVRIPFDRFKEMFPDAVANLIDC